MASKSKSAEARRRASEARAAAARAEQRKQRLRLVTGAVVAVVLALVVGIVIYLNQSGKPAASAPIPSAPATAASGRTTNPPWSAPANPAEAVKAAGLSMLSSEGTAEHIHAHLDIIVNGQPVSVPAGIGIDEQAQKISPLHSHDTSGVLHIESPVKADFSLGQFFTEWQVALSADQLGGLSAGGGNELHAYVNGKLYQGNPAAIILHAHDEIALVYGTAAQQANPPASYHFPSGE